MNHSLIKAACVTSLIFGVVTNTYADVVEEIDKSFDVDAKASLRLENINGSVNISAWDKEIIKVTAVITADEQDDLDRITIEMNQNSRGVNVETEYEKSSRWGNSHNTGKVDYTIFVPKSADLSSIDLVNGSLVIKDVEGEINADLVNGSIEASGLSSASEFNSVNGSIKVSYRNIDRNVGRIELETVNGGIKLYVPDDLNASVSIETMHGGISNDFGLKSNKNMFSGRSLKGDVGNGDVQVTLESVNGSVKLLKN